MSKELETLKDLKNAFVGHCRELKCETNYIKVCENKFNEIETALKDLDRYDAQHLGIREMELNDVKDRLKALEIIKKKKVDIDFLFEEWEEENYEFALENYNFNHDIELTQEEYELLKEVLL